MTLRSGIDAARFRFGTWRQRLRRRYLTRARHVPEPRPAEDVTVSVVVPVKNAGPELRPLIERIRAQQGFRGVEVVVVDSGSTDGSAEEAEALGTTVVRIAPADFSHSYARNLGAERASGDYVLFTVQDALPPADDWLLSMFAALRRHQAAAVSCGEEPRPDADLFYRAISWYHGRFMSPQGGDAVLFHTPGDAPLERRRNAQLSDTACLIRRDLFLRYRHRGNYAEDLELGLRLTADRHRLVYLSSPRIVHSHNRPAYYHLRRCYVEHLTLWDLLPGYPMPPPGDADSVRADVADSFAALSHAVTERLASAPTPCPTHLLRSAIADAMTTSPGAASGDGSGLVDPRTRALLHQLVDGRARGGAERGPGHLANAVVGVANMVCDYLEQASQPMLDAERRAEYTAALGKGWALNLGVLLASVYWRGPEAARAWMRDLHQELTSGV